MTPTIGRLRDRISGDFVETGIWRGGACIMMAAVLAAYECRDRKVWGFDSFQGLPPPNESEYPAIEAISFIDSRNWR